MGSTWGDYFLRGCFAWQFSPNANVRISPGFGLNDQSHRFLLRFGVTYEINNFGRKVKNLFR